MSTTTLPVFDASAYDLQVPVTDGLKADRLAIAINGRIELDRTNQEHLDMINALQLGKAVTVNAEAICVGKPSTYTPSTDGPGTVGYQVTLRITDATIT